MRSKPAVGTPSPHALRELIDGGNGSDRAFVDAVLRIEWSRTAEPAKRAELGELHVALRAAAMRSHAAVRQQITEGELRPGALRRLFDDVPLFERDHFVEEILGIAYPPLDEPGLVTSEHMTYAPSGYDEIVHAFELTQLGPADKLLDLGSGLGKVVMLAALLTGAESSGVERDGRLCELSTDAAGDLGVLGVRTLCADARDVSSTDADVVFMYLPFAGEALARVLERLQADSRRPPARSRQRFLCTGPIDHARYPALAPVGAAKSWLNVYAWR